jgi:D-3-phosphoglycerate dehydrogenase
LPPHHPLRTLENVTLSPHLGYCTTDNFKVFYEDTAEAIAAWLDGTPIRVMSHA